MAKNKQWYHKDIPLEEWLLEQFNFKDDTEYVIFLVWALYVTVFMSSFI